MLLLDYKKREGELIHFNIQDKIVFSYKFQLINGAKDRTHIKVILDRTDDARNGYEYENIFPLSKTALTKTIGVYVSNQLWSKLIRTEEFSTTRRDRILDCFTMPSQNKEVRKLKSYIYLRSKKISQVLAGIIWRELLIKHKVTDEEMYEISGLSWLMYPNNNKLNWSFQALYDSAKRMNPSVWVLLKSDLRKYNRSLCKYLLNKIYQKELYDISVEQYIELIKDAPDLIKQCKYGFDWNDEYTNAKISCIPIPSNRWQWFCLRVSLTCEDIGINNDYEHNVLQEFIDRLAYSDISMWHYYKKAMHIVRPYSFKEIHHMVRTVADGARIYQYHKDNAYHIPFVPLDGSPKRMIRNAIYNHRQEQEMNKKRQLSGKNYIMPMPPIKLPDWLEKIRLKTAHDMIKAGIECRHCIGSYTNSADIFIREKDICAQIDRRNLNIIQCFDLQDQITKRSEDMKKKINKALEPLKGVMSNV